MKSHINQDMECCTYLVVGLTLKRIILPFIIIKSGGQYRSPFLLFYSAYLTKIEIRIPKRVENNTLINFDLFCVQSYSYSNNFLVSNTSIGDQFTLYPQQKDPVVATQPPTTPTSIQGTSIVLDDKNG